MANDSANEGGALPPKLDLRNNNVLKNASTPAAGKPAAKPSSVIKPPAAGDKAAAKKATSKIDLGAAMAASANAKPGQAPTGVGAKMGGPPSTIKLEKPAPSPTGAAPSTIKLGKPAPSPTGAPPSTIKLKRPTAVAKAPSSTRPPAPLEDKGKTSRISLEAAVPPQEGAEKPDGGPKTIRLKRPSEIATVRVSQRPKIATTADEAPLDEDLGKTARLEETTPKVETSEDGETPTRRKTIRVKRPSRGAGVKGVSGVSVARGGAKAVRAKMPIPVAPEPNWFFSVCTIFAILVTGTAIYVLAAQAFGRNLSLTELSWGQPEMNLPFYGKILPPR